MNDEANVGLVDIHAQGDGGNRSSETSALELREVLGEAIEGANEDDHQQPS